MTSTHEQIEVAMRIASTFAPYGTAKWVVAYKAALAALRADEHLKGQP